MISFLVVIVVSNNSAGSIAQPAIGVAFGAGPADVGWIVFGFGTGFATATAVWGGLAGRFGLGPCFAAGTLLFSAGSLAAVLAPTLPVLIAARVVQGIGAGAIPTLSQATISRLFEGPARARALGTTVGAVALGIALGPILGGVALDAFGWRGPMAFGIVATPVAVVLARAGTGDPRSRIDIAGALLVAIAVGALTFALNRVPVLGLTVPTLLSVGLLAAASLLLARRSARPDAFVPRRIVGDPAFRRLVVLGMVGMIAFLGTLVLVPLAAARAHGLDGLGLGLVILPMAVIGAVFSRQNARVQARLGRRTTTLLSLATLAAAAVAVGLVGPAAPPPAMALALSPLGVGFALLQSPLVNELSQAFGDADRPAALGLYNLGFFVGGSAGAAIATALIQSGVELAPFAGSAVPGFTTTQILLAVPPLLGIALIAAQTRAGEVPAAAA